MKNREKYSKEIVELASRSKMVAVYDDECTPKECNTNKCNICKFNNRSNNCTLLRKIWFEDDATDEDGTSFDELIESLAILSMFLGKK